MVKHIDCSVLGYPQQSRYGRWKNIGSGFGETGIIYPYRKCVTNKCSE